MADSLLWPGASPMMRAVSDVGAARPDIPRELVEALWSPATCPDGEPLAHLAAAVGVAVWNPDWSSARKRRVIARTITLKRRRGTLPAFVEHLEFVDAELVELRAAPQIAAPRPSRTPAERAAWAAQFPELRVYAYRLRHVRRGIMIAGRPLGGSRRVARGEGGEGHVGSRATIVEHGVETEIPVEAVGGVYRVAVPARGRRFTLGRPMSRAMATPRPSTAGDRIFTYRPGSIRFDTLRAGLTPIDINPTRVAQVATRGQVMTPGRALFGARRFARPSTAKERVFDSLRLFDAAKARAGRVSSRGGWILGRTKLGQPPFELEIAVDLSRQVKGRRPFPRLPGRLRAHDGRRTAEAIEAIRAAKLGRDRVLVRTGLSRPIAIGDGITVDSGARVGQIIRSL